MFRRHSARHGSAGRGLVRRKGLSKESACTESSTGESPCTLEQALAGANFPIRSRFSLVAALGGPGKMLQVDGLGLLSAGEIADLCFSEASAFENADQLLRAVKRSSWVRVVIRRLNFQWFPIHGPGRLSALIGEVKLDGIRAKELLAQIQYPVTSVADLLEKLAHARGFAG